MPTHVALLRAVNVGGRQLAMGELREVVAGLGHSHVATYIQSGNVVFGSASRSTTRLATELEAAITRRFGMEVPVIVLARRHLEAVVDANPYPKESNHRLLHAVFMRAAIGADGMAAIRAAEERARAKGSDDEATAIGGTLYLHTPGGFGRSVLAVELGRAQSRAVMAAGTARNWATVLRLLELLTG